jgi:hypothetical protein
MSELDDREKMFMAVNMVRNHSTQRYQISKSCRIVNSILNGVWQVISGVAIIMSGMILIVVSRPVLVEWIYPWFATFILITSFGFGLWQGGHKSDSTYIEWGVKKDRKSLSQELKESINKLRMDKEKK